MVASFLLCVVSKCSFTPKIVIQIFHSVLSFTCKIFERGKYIIRGGPEALIFVSQNYSVWKRDLEIVYVFSICVLKAK